MHVKCVYASLVKFKMNIYEHIHSQSKELSERNEIK